MDLASVNIVVGVVSSVMMMIAIIYVLTYMLGSFSSRSGSMSLRFVLLSLLYFFGTAVLLFAGAQWLRDLARTPTPQGIPFYLNVGAGVVALNMLLHILCGSLTLGLYVKGKLSR